MKHGAAFAIPILTLPDPKTTGEGVLDPLGLATLADHLADWILPGMTARMIRPRFLTAIAVCAAVCDGLEDEIAADGVSPAYLVFEWLLVEGFARAAERSTVLRTPGIDKASRAVESGSPMSARAYLKAATVFGFNGVYKRLARYLGIVDANLCLAENGHALLKVWEKEQGVDGFVELATTGSFSGVKYVLREAVRDGLRLGYTQRSSGWQGWSLLARHLAPAATGRREGDFILRLFCSAGDEPLSNEVFAIVSREGTLKSVQSIDGEAAICETALAPSASKELRERFKAIDAYETSCTLIEAGFDWLRYLSSSSGAPQSPRGLSVRNAVNSLRSIVEVEAEPRSVGVSTRLMTEPVPDTVRRVRLYLNTSPLNRPFDDLTVPNVRAQAEAVLLLVAEFEAGRAELLASQYLLFEVEQTPDRDRARRVRSLLGVATSTVKMSPAVVARARALERCGLRGLDVLHVASAEAGGADLLVTTDDRMLRNGRVSYTGAAAAPSDEAKLREAYVQQRAR